MNGKFEYLRLQNFGTYHDVLETVHRTYLANDKIGREICF